MWYNFIGFMRIYLYLCTKTALTKIIKSEVIHMKLWGGRFTKEDKSVSSQL